MMKKYKTEKDVVIKTLTDAELADYGPPVSFNKGKSTFDNPEKNSESKDNSEGTTIIRRPKNSSCVTIVEEVLGVGGFSKVYKSKKEENKAIKKIMSNPKIYSAKLTIVDSIKREIFGMTRCACKHTVKVFDVIQNQNQDNFYILMELCDGNLEQLCTKLGRPLNTGEIKEILNQLNEVFYKLYYYNIIHRDIKPTNILYLIEPESDKNKEFDKNLPFGGKNLTFKLTDYGVCLPLYTTQYSISQFMGTLDFMAPEIYEKRSTIDLPVFTTKIDLFSLGQSILNLMGFIKKAKPLDYRGINDLRKENTLFDGNYEDQLLADLIFNNLLVADPDDRANWELYFFHPFFEKRIEENVNLENDKSNQE
jgi:serine/threonine protein kinase